MVKAMWLALLLAFCACRLSSSIVINEIMYDPVGTDTGYEWIELYNNGNSDLNLEGSKLQVAGASFATVFTFPYYILRAGRFVLIGEQNITQAVFNTALVMQNGGDATDGVRFISADNSYTDTVLYDSPNSNHLTDDSGSAGTSFAPDVAAGFSLARRTDGLDTNNCEFDFVAEANPTPGLPNRFPIDYSLSETELVHSDEVFTLNTYIVNNSPANCDTLTITLKVSLDGLELQSFDIQPVAAGESVYFTSPVSINSYCTGILSVELVLLGDSNPADNVWTTQLGNPQLSSLCINEIMYNPDTGNQEWIELFVPAMVGGLYEVTIVDAADNSAQVTLPSLCPNYLVLCRDHASLLLRYPDCPPANVLQVGSLPILNNDGDVLILKDETGTVIDSMSYIGVSSKKDVSLERQVSADSIITWQYCYNEAGGTPGQANSAPPPPSELNPGSVKIVGSPFNPLRGESMRLQYNFSDLANSINCYVYDLNGIKRHTIASGLSVGSSGEIIWNGKDNHDKPLSRGIYILLVEVKNSSKHYFLRKQLTVVLATK
ncbi:MAG: lamin tail domain-containing protein [Candidatus Cloacimonadaceae bacterium]